MIITISGVVAVFIIYKRRSFTNFSREQDEPITQGEIATKSKRVPLRKIMAGDVEMPPKEEFEKLFRFQDNVTSRLTQYQGKRNDGKDGRNLNSRALPFDCNRVELKNPVDGNDYVNASWIKSNTEDSTYDEIVYSDYIPYAKIDFIVGQKPLPNTLLHHYQMLHENKVDIEIYIHYGTNRKPLIPGKVYHTGNLSRRVFTSTQIGENLIMTEMEFFDTTSSKTQFKHPMTLFELTGFPKQELDDVSDVNAILESICLIRKHIKGDSKNMTIMVHDPDGGISGAACVIALYNLLQNVDEGLNEKNEIKKSASDVEVFREINKLRHVRGNMVDNFGTYQMIHQCLSYYGKNKAHFDRIKPKAPIAEVDKIYRQSNRILTLISNKMAKNQAKNFTARSLLKYPISAIGTKAKESSHEKGGGPVIVNTGHSSQPDVNDFPRENLPDDIYFTEDIYVN